MKIHKKNNINKYIKTIEFCAFLSRICIRPLSPPPTKKTTWEAYQVAKKRKAKLNLI